MNDLILKRKQQKIEKNIQINQPLSEVSQLIHVIRRLVFTIYKCKMEHACKSFTSCYYVKPVFVFCLQYNFSELQEIICGDSNLKVAGEFGYYLM